jgi:hypothetical protein
MNNEAMKEVLNELFSHLEKLETQSEAILQFLKEKKRVTDKQLAPYLEQAGNASNVRWRAARVRIEHLLEPEHPEKELKLGKPPELQEDSSSAASSEEKGTEAGDKEDKRIESGDIKSNDKDKSAPAEAAQARPADGKADKPEMKSESTLEQNKKNAEAKGDERSNTEDSVHHPTELTEPLAEREGAEPAAQLNSEDKDDDQEAA